MEAKLEAVVTKPSFSSVNVLYTYVEEEFSNEEELAQTLARFAKRVMEAVK